MKTLPSEGIHSLAQGNWFRRYFEVVLPQFEAPDALEREDAKTPALETIVRALVQEKQVEYQARAGVEVRLIAAASSTALPKQCNPLLLQTVLSNLINNAVEAIPERGLVSVHVQSDADKIRISVTDTGCGIDAETLERIKNEGGSYGKPDGNGLGLSHARTQIQLWNGKFDLVSTRGFGTSVQLEIPRWTADLPEYAQAIC